MTKIGAIEHGWILRSLLLRNHPMLTMAIKILLEYLRSEVPEVANQVFEFVNEI